MDVLTDAAAAAAPAAAADAEEQLAEGAADKGKTKVRGSALGAAEKRLVERRTKISELEGKILKLQSMAQLKARERQQLEKQQGQLEAWRGELPKLVAAVDALKEKAHIEATKAAAKAAAAAEQEEVSRAMTEAGLMLLCELRGQYSKKFDNTSDKVDNIW